MTSLIATRQKWAAEGGVGHSRRAKAVAHHAFSWPSASTPPCKRALGSPNRPAITLHFLNAVLQFPSPIREVQILNPTTEKGHDVDGWIDSLNAPSRSTDETVRSPITITAAAKKSLIRRTGPRPPTGRRGQGVVGSSRHSTWVSPRTSMRSPTTIGADQQG